MSRTAIFIDGAYLDFTLRDEFQSARIDYSELALKLAGGVDLLRTYYYHCLPYQPANPIPEEAQRFGAAQHFFAMLHRLPRFEVRLGVLAFRGRDEKEQPIFVQKQVDILLGVDLVLLAAKHQITHATILAGDSDFLPAVTAAKTEGVLIHLFHGSVHRPHVSLWDACDERTLITKNLIDSILRP
jgi:uncharacterized LabA/DUF88 family protein